MIAAPAPARPSISVVIPVYGCAECLPELHRRLTTALTSFTADYQIILVNDHSPDNSWSLVEGLAAHDPCVLGLSLSRNFGQHAAITAGLDRASGEWVVVMDCDLQDMPEEIPNLYEYARSQGLDVVFGRRADRQDTATKQWGGQAFHRVLGWLGGPRQDPATGNFGIFHQRVVAGLRLLREPTRAFPLQVRWLGFRQGALDVQHAARTHGKSSYRFSQLVRMAFNIILAYSDKPLRLLVKLGTGIVVTTLLGGVVLTTWRWSAGWGTRSWVVAVLLSLWLLGGLMLAGLGLVGLYVGRTFEGVKNRPLYVVREEVGTAAEIS
ncbi:glycosyltransferase family 2 protein [Hymenobacter cellulosilyticus]|uniref:Glycosyltransferase family 2 protein n=1 Tax=Hymenobacter cellulosilyticus TaxID=2932248 RepID=A0A8T9Q9H6_9BACT|nr:glycosyltransferase family 2 protein [Hymenobacter cellulosilyticus]UOQ74216.1 glycosyltransferase family 2 protein [Hymenobacter cellulosilyticus]